MITPEGVETFNQAYLLIIYFFLLQQGLFLLRFRGQAHQPRKHGGQVTLDFL